MRNVCIPYFIKDNSVFKKNAEVNKREYSLLSLKFSVIRP